MTAMQLTRRLRAMMPADRGILRMTRAELEVAVDGRVLDVLRFAERKAELESLAMSARWDFSRDRLHVEWSPIVRKSGERP